MTQFLPLHPVSSEGTLWYRVGHPLARPGQFSAKACFTLEERLASMVREGMQPWETGRLVGVLETSEEIQVDIRRVFIANQMVSSPLPSAIPEWQAFLAPFSVAELELCIDSKLGYVVGPWRRSEASLAELFGQKPFVAEPDSDIPPEVQRAFSGAYAV